MKSPIAGAAVLLPLSELTTMVLRQLMVGLSAGITTVTPSLTPGMHVCPVPTPPVTWVGTALFSQAGLPHSVFRAPLTVAV